jgi:hypothetical protein
LMSGLIQGKPVNRPRGRSRRWAPVLGQEQREEMQKSRRLNGRFFLWESAQIVVAADQH